MIPLSISIGASIFPHDGDSYETLLATADSRMYRDKTRRKRQTSQDQNDDHGDPSATSSSPTASPSEIELKRAATGIL